MLSSMFAVIAPVFLIAGVGFFWSRQNRPFDVETVTSLSTTIGVPCLVLDALMGAELETAVLGQMLFAAALGTAAIGLGALVLLRAARLPLPPYLPAMMFGNTGNVGLPLCLFAFGQEGLALAVSFFVVTATLNFTLGVAVASGRVSVLTMLRTPVVWALVLALTLKAGGLTLPSPLANAVHLLAGMTIPLMLVALGVSLGRLRARTLGRTAALSALKLALGWSAGLLVVWALGLTGVARGVVLIELAMPVAVTNYLFAQRFDNRPEDVAGMVLVSTLLAFLLMPPLLWLAWGGTPPSAVGGPGL